MNNIVKKNILYSLSTNYDLPYQTRNDVSLKANQIIYTSINNNLQKLVDNDLYTERRLLDTYNYQIGPETIGKQPLSSLVDGYKVWDGLESGNLSILHKYESDVSSTINKIDSVGNSDIRFITDIGELLIGTNNGLYRSTDSRTWTKEKSGVLSASNIFSKFFNHGNESLVLGTDNGIYQLSNYEDVGDTTVDLQFFRKDDGIKLDKKNINSITVDEDDNTMYIGTNEGLYMGHHSEDAQLKDEIRERYLADKGSIADVKILDNKEVLVMTESAGLYKKQLEYGVKEKEKERSETFSEIKNGYVTSTHGLYEVTTDGQVREVEINEYQGKNIRDVLKNGDDLYVATSEGLYRGTKLIDDDTTITKIYKFSDILMIACEDRLYYVQLSNTTSMEALKGSKTELDFTEGTILSMQDYNGQLFVSTTENVYLIEKKSTTRYNAALKNVTDEEGGTIQLTDNINVMMKISDGTILIGTNKCLYQTDSTFRLYKKIDGIDVRRIKTANGRYFIASSDNHIYIYSTSFKQFHDFHKDDIGKIRDIDVTDSGILVTTDINLYRYSMEGDTILSATESRLFDTQTSKLVGTTVTEKGAFLATEDSMFVLSTDIVPKDTNLNNLGETAHYKQYSPTGGSYFSTTSGIKRSMLGPEGELTSVPEDIKINKMMKDSCTTTRVKEQMIYATTSDGLEYTRCYFDDRGEISSTDELSSVESMSGKTTNDIVCVKDSVNDADEELSNQTYLFVGTDDGLYYNKTQTKMFDSAYPYEALETVVFDTLSSKIITTEGEYDSEYQQLIVCRGRNGNGQTMLFSVSNGRYDDSFISAVNMGNAEIYRIYPTYYTNDDRPTPEKDISLNSRAVLIACKNGLVAQHIPQLSDSDNQALENVSLTAGYFVSGKFTAITDVNMWSSSSETKNYMVQTDGTVWYNQEDKMISVFAGQRGMTKSRLTLSTAEDICVTDQDTMYVLLEDGLHRFSSLTSDIKGTEQPAKCTGGTYITTANRILKIDEDNIMLVGTAQVQVVHKQGDTPGAAKAIQGTVNGIYELNDTIRIYTTEKIYEFDRKTRTWKNENTPDASVCHTRYFTESKKTLYYTKNGYYYKDIFETYDYTKLTYSDLQFAKVQSMRTDYRNNIYLLSNNKVYKFTKDFLNVKPTEIKIQIPLSYTILQIYADTDSVYYCAHGEGKLVVLKYRDDTYVETTTVQNFNASDFVQFYIWNGNIYILKTDGNYKVITQKNVKYNSMNVLSRYEKVNDVTYYGNNPIFATERGIVEYDTEQGKIQPFNDSRLAKIPIKRIHNCGDVYAASGESGLSTFSDQTEFIPRDYISDFDDITQFLNDDAIGTESGLFFRNSYQTFDPQLLRTMDYSFTKMWIQDGILYAVKDGIVNILDKTIPEPYVTRIDNHTVNVSDMFKVNGITIHVYNNGTYNGGIRINNIENGPTSMYGNGYGWYISEGVIYKYNGIGINTTYVHIPNTALQGVRIKTSIDIDGRMILMSTDRGLKRYDFITNVVEDIDDGDITFLREDFSEIDEDTEQPRGRYLYGKGNKVYKIYFDELYNDSQYVTEIFKNPDRKVTDMMQISRTEMLFCSDNGLYRTYYTFTMGDDFYCGEISTVTGEISTYYNDIINGHIDKYHKDDSVVTILNRDKMPSDCSDSTRLQENHSIQDIVNTVQFDDFNKYITARSIHGGELSSLNVTDIEGISYIEMKNINSSNSDIYINIPTTNTYYNAHMNGVPNCVHDMDYITQENSNTVTSRNILDNMTHTVIELNNTHFGIKNILHVEANGSSLPMKIYKNQQKEMYPDWNNFTGLIKPTTLYGFPDNITEDKVILEIVSYGTDEQNVHIKTENIKKYKITFLKTDGTIFKEVMYTTFKPNNPVVTDEIVEGCTFYGWTINGQIIEKNGYININIDYIGQNFVAYPIFKEYVFDHSNTTVLTMKVKNSGFYFNGQMVEAETVIDYDSIVDQDYKHND